MRLTRLLLVIALTTLPAATVADEAPGQLQPRVRRVRLSRAGQH